jgi:hypothetical protein
MEKEKLSVSMNQKIEEVNHKLQEIKNELALQNDKEISEQAKPALAELEQLRDKIQSLHEKIAKIRLTDELEFDKVEKNIYNSIESFNNAFKKAGSMLRIHKK